MTLLLAGLHVIFLAILAVNVVTMRRSRDDWAEPDAWPTLSVLIPARNEEANLRRLLPTLAEQDYPGVEVIVYDDGSEDGTGAVVEEMSDERFRLLRGEGPPPGWVGKVHALYRATQEATGEVYLFLDADAALLDGGALRRLVGRLLAVEARAEDEAVVSGLPRLRGGGLLLTSLVPFAILTALPVALIPRTKSPTLASLNGQCWAIRSEVYHRHAPHASHPAEVLEDVRIGRFLKASGLRVELHDLQDELEVWMYRSLGEAWAGFRKNVYLLQGGTPLRFLAAQAAYWTLFVLPPLLSPWFLVSLYALKAGSDAYSRFPWRVRLLAPLSLLLGGVLPFDSAIGHWSGRVRWKGRSVGRR